MDLRKREAVWAANFIKTLCPELKEKNEPIGLVLGTGWDVLENHEVIAEIAFADIPDFNGLAPFDGHARVLWIGKIAGKLVLALRGRIHLNEAPNDPNITRMVRLQVEMLFQLGVKDIIVTSAVGSLDKLVEVGSVAIVDGFVTIYAPDMPLWAGEFCSPDDAISERLLQIAFEEERGEIKTQKVGHVMLRGPFFEGRKYDKALLAKSGAKVVGMSMLPEACVAALYGANFLGLGFVTNNHFEVHSDEENKARAKQASKQLNGYLTRIISRI